MFSKYKKPALQTDNNATNNPLHALPFIDLKTAETPRAILEADFPRLAPLPIHGGWGYSRETACVIDKHDPSVDQNRPFNGVSYEYLFAEYRLYEELIVFKPRGEQFAGIKHRLSRKETRAEDGRSYDVLTFDVVAFRQEDFDRLREQYEGPDGVLNPAFDSDEHEALRASLIHTGERTFWFDITSFYG